MLYFGVLRPRHEQALHDLQQTLVDEQELRLLKERMQEQLAERSKTATQAAATSEPPKTSNPPAPAKSRGTSRVIVPPPAKRCRDDGDPLNPCLKP